MLREHFEKLAIRHKLYFMHLLVTGAAVMLVFVAVVTYQFFSFKHDLISDLESQLSVIENNMGATIAFEDANAAYEILNSLSMNKSVEHAYVVRNNNIVFTEFRPEAPDFFMIELPAPFNIKPEKLHLSRKIMVNQAEVGTIHLTANMDKMNARIQIFALFLLFAVAMAMVLARFISRRLNRYITEPLGYLEHLVTRITQQQDYTDRSSI
ncbi:MAG: CHASE sensor domain-containing protein, partial [Nitrosomonadales bacterium]|nr:CHASE sensor domain-containing protein [Nitrosomonadales bacterium]